jgi:hypothetical protein
MGILNDVLLPGEAPFVPEALSLAEVDGLYLPVLKQIEAQVLEAWQAAVLEPGDAAVVCRYGARLDRLTDLRADYERVREILRREQAAAAEG